MLTGQLRQSDNICNIAFFRQTALQTQRALKIQPKMLFVFATSVAY